MKNSGGQIAQTAEQDSQSGVGDRTSRRDLYEYYPLGRYLVAAPGVCGGRPSIKYTRIDARHVIGSLRAGDSPREISRYYKIPVAAVEEAVELSDRYDYEESYA